MSRQPSRLALLFVVALALCSAAMADDSTSPPGAGAATSSGKEPAIQPSNGPTLVPSSQAIAAGEPDDASLPGPPQPSASAEEQAPRTPPPAEKPWEVTFKVYGWFPGIGGRGGIRGSASSVDLSLCDVLNDIDPVECLVPVDLEVRRGQWGAFADLLHGQLEYPRTERRARVDVQGELTLLELGGFYRVGTWPLGSQSDSTVTLDILGGARYNRIGDANRVQTPIGPMFLSQAEEWWDPFVGPRITWHALDKLDLYARADVGGFGGEHSSHVVWQFLGAAKYDFTKNFFVELGYRLLDTDFDSGSGRDLFTYDIRMAGPYMAVGVKF